MNISSILQKVQSKELSITDAESLLQQQHQQHPDNNNVLKSFANLDHDRMERTGFPEAVFSLGKTPEQISKILDNMALRVNDKLEQGGDDGVVVASSILATRVDQELYEKVASIPLNHGTIKYNELARMIIMKPSSLQNIQQQTQTNQQQQQQHRIVIACAGTTDVPIAEEAAITLEQTTTTTTTTKPCHIDRIYDVGVAGLHRIINALPTLRHPHVRCIIVCAGMDGALPSVVAGLVNVPVIAIPTSVGYGMSLGGVSAMLTMLNSCAPGVGVVNVDNGFGGAVLAFKFLNGL